jgi:WhiB family redox-sensing transcriptional regulator
VIPVSTPDHTADTSWLLLAACRGTNTNLFFPTRGDNRTLRDSKKICASCPVRQQCLHQALLDGEKFGVFGGTSERQRRRLRLQTNAQPQKVPQT